jgi:hypothetical protein
MAKVSQVIWLKPEVLAKCAELAAQRRKALNTVIAEVVEEYFQRPVQEVIREVPREVFKEREVFMCPWCFSKFEKDNTLILHIKTIHKEELRNLR